jgi:glycosyltransferase involved in cell wall biosynthesis
MVTTTIKRLVRPFIPDRVMARYRLHQHSRGARVNVDVFLDDASPAKRWLTTTPDTYRVRLSLPSGSPPDDVVILGEATEDAEVRALQVLADPYLGAAVVAEVARPHLVGTRRAEPEMGPTLMAVRREIVDEVGGIPSGEWPLPGLLARVRDAGHPFGLIPVPMKGAPIHRSDPLEGDAIVILAAVPMHDVGGGARSTQLAIEFLSQGLHVTLVSLYEAQETVDLGLRHIHPRLEQYRIDRFRPDLVVRRSTRPGMVLVEAPARPLAEAAYELADHGWELVYDVIDDWSDPALGGEWFDEATEQTLVARADRVTASAPDLVDRAWRLGREAILVPNAVNAELFGVDLPPRPSDLPDAELILGYHGSLYGDWFDWAALRAVAEAFPEAAVVVIGDDKAARPEMPANVHFLGLKAQSDLPAYLQRFDVGLLPFKVNDTTHAVSPLKVYEYLASGVPVAAPPLRSIVGLPATSVDQDLRSAVRDALVHPAPSRVEILAQHSWTSRTSQIRASRRSSPSTFPTEVISRVPVHWARRDRLIQGVHRAGEDA